MSKTPEQWNHIQYPRRKRAIRLALFSLALCLSLGFGVVSVFQSSVVHAATPEDAFLAVPDASGHLLAVPDLVDDYIVYYGFSGNTIEFDVLANDSDTDGHPLTITSFTQPPGAATSLIPGTGNSDDKILYDPPNFIAAGQLFTFTYTVSDGQGNNATATAVVQNNRPPQGNSIIFGTNVTEGQSHVFDLITGGEDPDGDPVTISTISTPDQGGTVTILDAAEGTILYTAPFGYTGSEQFNYRLSDEYLTSNNASGVSIQVQEIVDAHDDVFVIPSVSVAPLFDVNLGVGDNDTPQNLNSSITAIGTPPSGATAAVNIFTANNGPDDINYGIVPNFVGTDIFTYTVSHGGRSDTATATVIVYDSNAADTVFIASGQSFSTVSIDINNGFVIGTVAAASITANATLQSWTLVSQSIAGAFSLSASGEIVVANAAALAGVSSATIDVTVSDGINVSVQQTITINIVSFAGSVSMGLNGAEPLPVNSAFSYSFMITNTSGATVFTLPFTVTYANQYVGFNSVLSASIDPDNFVNDGQLNWANIVGAGGLAHGESMLLIVYFTAAGETSALANGESIVTSALPTGIGANDGVTIDPAETKLLLGDVIWHDIDNDGIQDANEPGVDGVLVNLYEVINGGNTFVISTTTMTTNTVSGFYQFDAVSGKNYMIEVAASNFVADGPLEGFVVAANQPDITGTTVATQTTLNTTVNVDTLDFGFYCRFDLALDKKLTSASPISPGDDVTFTISVYNQGIVTASNVVVADYIPAGFALSAANTATWNDGPTGTVTTTLAGTLTPSGTVGSTAVVEIILTAGANLSGSFTNTAEIADYTSAVQDVNGADLPDADSTPDTTDGNGSNGNGGENGDLEDDQVNEDGTLGGQDEDDHDIAPVTVAGIFDLALRKSLVGPATIGPGEDVTFTVEIFNQGTISAANLLLADYIPTGFSLSTSDGNGWTPPGSTGTVTNTIAGTLAPSGTVGSSASVNIRLTAGTNIISGTYTNRAEIAVVTDINGVPVTDIDSTPDATDGNGSNGNGGESGDLEDDQLAEDGKTPGQDEDDHDLASVLVQTEFDLALIKVTDAASVSAGDMVTFTLYVQNQGNIDASNVEVCDWVPAGFVAPTAINNPDPNWNFLAPYPIYTIPNLDAGQTVSFTLVMEVDTDAANGNLTNQAGIRQADRDDDPTPTGTDTRTDEDGTFTGPRTTPPYAPPFPTGVVDQLNPSDVNIDLVPGDDDDHDIASVLLAGTPALQVVKTLNGDNPFGVNQTISFTIRITNTGDVTITVLPLEDRYNDVFITSPTASTTPDSNLPGVMIWNDLTDDLGDVAPGLGVNLVVSFTTASDTTLLLPVAPCTSSGHTPNIVKIENAMADPDGTGQMPAVQVAVDDDDDDCAEVQILNPTAVQLAERGMSATPDGVMVRWSTLSESEVVGFNILKSNGVESELRSSEMIVAQKAGQSSGANYQWLDTGTSLNHGDTYILEIVNNDGTTDRTVIAVMSGERIFLPFLAR